MTTQAQSVAIESSQINPSGVLQPAGGGTGVTTSTGSGSNVLSNSPSLTTPTIGSGSILNASGKPIVPQTGSVLKVQQSIDAGSTTSAGSFSNMNGTYFSFTPVSTSSILYFICTFYAYLNPNTGYGAGGCYAFYALGEVLSGTPTVFSPTGYLWNYQYSTGYSQSISAQGVMTGYQNNNATTTRQFDLMAAVSNSNLPFTAANINMTIIEVAN